MKYDKRINGIWKCCSKKLSRYSLSSARLDADRKTVVATDGHILTAVDVSDLMDDGEESFLIPLEALKFAQSLSKEDSPVVRIEGRGDSVCVIQGGRDIHFYYPPANAAFPQWESATPASMNNYKPCVTISAELLLSLSDSLRGAEDPSGVCLWIKDKDSQIVVTHPLAKGKYSVLMPMRGEIVVPNKFWEKKVVEEKKAGA